MNEEYFDNMKNKDMQKVALVELVSSHGGMNYYDYGLLKGISNLNELEMHLYTGYDLIFPIPRNCCIHYTYDKIFNIKNKIHRFFKYLVCTYNTFRDIKKRKIQVVHLQIFQITLIEMISLFFAKFFFFKTVVTIHDIESFKNNNLMHLVKIYIKKVDKIIVHNDFSKNELVGKYKETKGKVEIIHHGSYLGMLELKKNKIDARKKLNIDLYKNTILFFGQIKEVKGLDVLLKAIPEIIKKTNNIQFVIAGKMWNEDRKKYDDLIRELGIIDYLKLDIKYIPDNEVVDYYSAADYIVLPYKKIYQSGVLLMAMSYRVPVIVSDLPAMKTIIVDNENGFIFKSENYSDLSKVILKAITINGYDICKRAELLLEQKYNWDIIGRETANIYKILGRH